MKLLKRKVLARDCIGLDKLKSFTIKFEGLTLTGEFDGEHTVSFIEGAAEEALEEAQKTIDMAVSTLVLKLLLQNREQGKVSSETSNKK